MASIQQTSEKIKDILTLCLAKGIDESLKDSLGHDWFDYFKQDDSKNKREHMILRPEHHSIYDLDFQGLLKILKFHMDIRIYVLSYYHPQETDIDVKYGKNSLFDNLLYRLMTLYRNQIAAHKKASDVEKALSGSKSTTTYSYDDAITDMKKLAENFSSVTDNNGISYYSTICNIANSYYSQSSYTYYSIQETINAEQLEISRNEFIQICDEFGIKVASTDSQFVFATHNYNETVAIIKNQISLIRGRQELIQSQQNLLKESISNRAKNRRILIVSLAAVTVMVAVLFVIVLVKIPNTDENETSSKSDTTTSVSTTDSTTVTTESQMNVDEKPDTLADSDISGDTGNRYVNQYNYEPVSGFLSVKPANVYYDGDSIIAKCYIVNGTDHTVDSVLIHNFELTVNGKTICDGAFDGEGPTQVNLEPGEHEFKTFIFTNEMIKNKEAKLQNLDSFCDVEEAK